jgi:molybdate transport system ATP-binding protein
MATSPHEIPDAITNIAILQNGAITKSFLREEFKPELFLDDSPDVVDNAELKKLLNTGAEKIPYKYIVNMTDVFIKYGDKIIVNKINWQILPGERWALLGPNGAGKSTLLSLINADNPQAYANDIVLFDKKRGTGESIWDIKSKIGFVSPELHC